MGKFNKDLSKKISLETMGGGDGPADTQGIEIKSPGKMFWFTVKGETFDDLTEITTTQLYDPDGELQTYIIQADNKDLRNRIIQKADENINVRIIAHCINWFDTEFLWLPAIKSAGNSKIASQTAIKSIQRGLNGNWIKAKWCGNSTGWRSWSHPGTDKIPEWSKMTVEEIVDQVFDGRIIDTLEHEALIRNTGGKV
jgi:hypothetical protein